MQHESDVNRSPSASQGEGSISEHLFNCFESPLLGVVGRSTPPKLQPGTAASDELNDVAAARLPRKHNRLRQPAARRSVQPGKEGRKDEREEE